MFNNELEREKITGFQVNNQEISVVCAADNNYAMPLAVVLRSVAANLSDHQKANFFVIDGGITEHNKHKIQETVASERFRLNWLAAPKDLKRLKINSSMSISAYHRLLVTELLPSNLNKVIYLDSDLVVLGDLAQLWAIELEDKYLLAVQDCGIGYVSTEMGLVNYKELGLSENHKYFNSGVMVINLEKWRADSIGLKVLEYMRQNPQYIRWYDQDGLNAVLADKWVELDPRWNRTPQIFSYGSWEESPFQEAEFKIMVSSPYIIHFATTGRKPWNDLKYPDGDIFYRYLDMTAWAGWRYTRWHSLQHKLLISWRKFKRKLIQQGFS